MRPNPALLSAVCLIPLMASGALAQNAGITAAVNQQAAGTPPGGTVRTIVLGDNVVQNERIDTSADGLVQILLADGTAFTVGPNSSLSIDRFVYDPQAGSAEVAATLTQGVFRFIGGRTSKTPGGVVLNTPVGTAGIRGAIVDIVLNPGSNGTVAEFAMRFGQDVTLTRPGGATQRIYETGYSILVGADGRVSVIPTPPGSASAIQTALAGRPGTTGGAPLSPTNPMVAESPVPGANSEQPIVVIAAPVPTPRPEPIARQQEIVVAEAARDEIRGVIERTPGAPPPPEPPITPEPEPPVTPEPPVVEPPVTPEPEPEPPVEPEPPAPGEPGLAFRVFRGANDVFVTDVTDVETTTIDGRLRVPSGEEVADLPVLADPLDDGDGTPLTVTPFGTGSGQVASLGGRALQGAGYSGRDGFRAYLTRPEDGAGGLFFALSGPQTDVPSVFSAEPPSEEFPSGQRPVFAYSLQIDPIFGGAVPFARDRGIALTEANSSIGQLLIVGSEDVAERAFAKMMQSSLVIDGSGPEQNSQFVLNLGAIVNNGGQGFGLGAGRYGGERIGAETSYRGSLSTLTGPGGQNGFFGAGGEYLVLSGSGGAGLTELGAAGDVGAYSRTQLGVLQETFDGRFVPFGAELLGFSSGLATMTRGGQASFSRLRNRNEIGQDFPTTSVVLGLGEGEGPTDRNSVSSGFLLTSTGDIESLFVGTGGSSGPSALVSRDVYAAASNLDTELIVADVPQTPLGNSSSYLVSGRAVPIEGFDPFGRDVESGVSRCGECDFIDWGWWGTQGRGQVDAETVDVAVHLGNWVAGQVNNDISAFTVGTSATYQGGALGTVRRGGATYIASGNMTFEVNLGFTQEQERGTGQLTISSFDGRNFSGTGTITPSGFAINNLGGGIIVGSASGSFVDGPERSVPGTEFPEFGTDFGDQRGVIGNFDAFETSGGDWQATGVFAGERGIFVPEPPA